MQNFSYKRSINPEDVIINEPKKKINKQQIVFTVVFATLFSFLVWYFAKDIFTATFDGNIVSYHGESHLMDDAFLLDVRVKPGDIVEAGDTMLFFVYTDMLYSSINPVMFSNYQQNIFTLNISKYEQKLALQMLIEQRESLQLLLRKTQHNISLGLNTTSDETDYSIAIENLQYKLNYTQEIIRLYNLSIDSLGVMHAQPKIEVIDPFEHTTKYMNQNRAEFGNMLQYMVAPEKTLILATTKYPGHVVFKGEPIMLIYPINEGEERIHIEMIVPPRFLNEMNDGEKVEIYFGNEYMDSGTIKINNTYMRDVSSMKLGQFSVENEGAIIRVNIDNPSELSLKYQISGLPVKLNYKRNRHFFK